MRPPWLAVFSIVGACWTPRNVCGDGVVLVGLEACDDGVDNADDAACTTTCQEATCGDGLVWAAREACDDGADNADDAACTPNCIAATCGDGLVWVGQEGCDEGPDNADDAACTAACEPAACGDDLLWVGVEECDDGNGVSHDGCTSACRLPQQISLVEASATFVGEAGGDVSGYRVDGAGDVDGDGFDDVIIGALNVDRGGVDVGVAYLLYGPLSGQVNLADADAILIGESPGDNAGADVAGAGDLDGDGFDDLLIGSPDNATGAADAGVVYVVYGPVEGDRLLSNADATLIGEDSPDTAGLSVAGAGDVDGDGFGDVLVGALRNAEGGYDAGAAYLVRGPALGDLDLSVASGKLVGEEEGDNAGRDVASAGDIDGDGWADVLVGADLQGLSSNGAAYLVLGPVSGTIDLADSEARYLGEVSGDRAGSTVTGPGDLDGDGLSDVVIGARYHDAGGDDAGAVYLVCGTTSGDVDLGDADAKLIGEGPIDIVGNSVAGPGDVDGDGLADLWIGSPENGGATDIGAAYLLLGPLSGQIALSFADVKFVGEIEMDSAGLSVAGAGDVDGDGIPDLLVGAPYADRGDADVGTQYLIFGASL